LSCIGGQKRRLMNGLMGGCRLVDANANAMGHWPLLFMDASFAAAD
jgi:hypothetical protein